MSGIPFENTRRGAEYYDHHIPKIAKSLERIANALEKGKQADQVKSMTDEFVDREMQDLMRCTIRSTEPTQNGWISVEERMPEPLQNVIVCTNINTVTLAWFTGREWLFADTGNGKIEHFGYDAVTHWMHLPEPPKEVQDDESL